MAKETMYQPWLFLGAYPTHFHNARRIPAMFCRIDAVQMIEFLGTRGVVVRYYVDQETRRSVERSETVVDAIGFPAHTDPSRFAVLGETTNRDLRYRPDRRNPGYIVFPNL